MKKKYQIIIYFNKIENFKINLTEFNFDIFFKLYSQQFFDSSITFKSLQNNAKGIFCTFCTKDSSDEYLCWLLESNLFFYHFDLSVFNLMAHKLYLLIKFGITFTEVLLH